MVAVTGEGSRWTSGNLELASGSDSVLEIGAGGLVVSNDLVVDPGNQVILTGGELRAQSILLESGITSRLDLLTGRLEVGQRLDGDLFNLAVTYAPGASAASNRITGDFTQLTTAGLELQLGGGSQGDQYDFVEVVGTATLDGALDVALINGFTPSAGDTFEVLRAEGGVSGTFSSDAANLPDLDGGLTWQINYEPNSVVLAIIGGALAGDLNGNGLVNFGDLAPFVTALTDPDAYESRFPGLDRVARCDVNADGLCNFGDLPPFPALLIGAGASSGASVAQTVPEPSALTIVIVGCCLSFARRRETRVPGPNARTALRVLRPTRS